MAVLSVGSILAGDASNIIPDYHVRERVLDAVRRIVKTECDTCEYKQATMRTPYLL